MKRKPCPELTRAYCTSYTAPPQGNVVGSLSSSTGASTVDMQHTGWHVCGLLCKRYATLEFSVNLYSHAGTTAKGLIVRDLADCKAKPTHPLMSCDQHRLTIHPTISPTRSEGKHEIASWPLHYDKSPMLQGICNVSLKCRSLSSFMTASILNLPFLWPGTEPCYLFKGKCHSTCCVKVEAKGIHATKCLHVH